MPITVVKAIPSFTRSLSSPWAFIISQIINLTFGRWQRHRGNSPQLPMIGRPVGIFKFPLSADWLVGGRWSRESLHRSGLLSVLAARRRGWGAVPMRESHRRGILTNYWFKLINSCLILIWTRAATFGLLQRNNKTDVGVEIATEGFRARGWRKPLEVNGDFSFPQD